VSPPIDLGSLGDDPAVPEIGPEVSSVSEDEVVIHIGPETHRYAGLLADTPYNLDGVEVRTLPHPGGEKLATVATANDVHFGETECGIMEGLELGPVLRSEPGEPPYPVVMNSGAIAEIAALDDGRGADAVVVKGDLTAEGTDEQYAQFLEHYCAFGTRLHYIRGNHDAYRGQDYAADAPQEVSLPGVVLAILDTVIPTQTTGQVSSDQLDWLDELGARADRPVLVFGHHQPWDPSSETRSAGYFGISPDDSERLIAVFGRRPSLVGYFAGHTHRNRVRRFTGTDAVPWVEVAAVKDFPGAWAEYRVFEGGILQVHRRVSTPEALAWTERTRAMFGGLYPAYSFGTVEDRCFAIWPRRVG
jgi:3',5'-cyclic AMP phosphodiesterase CpdA